MNLGYKDYYIDRDQRGQTFAEYLDEKKYLDDCYDDYPTYSQLTKGDYNAVTSN